jgi:isoleucyl-tRNA synthetase
MNNNNTQKTINERELEVLKFWNDNEIFKKTLKENSGAENFTFNDGPPFATGLPHHGHLLQSFIKDSIPRYQTMKGKSVRRVWGWDCHGLPIENLIEKELGLKTRDDIEKLGVEKFYNACFDSILRYEKDWQKVIPRVGRWVEMERPYMTVNNTYTESVWWSFKELYNKGLAYEGYRVMHICPRCETPVAASEVALGGYKDVTDISVYVPFRILESKVPLSYGEGLGEGPVYLLAWTTTPWTLPGNTAIAINKNIIYVKVKIENKIYVVAKSRVGEILKLKNISLNTSLNASLGEAPQSGEGVVLSEFSGADLIGKRYEPVFDYYKNVDMSNKENIWKVWHADFVTEDTGTGIAHEAPAFGEEDMQLAKENNIPIIQHVKMSGEFTVDVKDFLGLKVKKKDDTQSTDIEIIKYLAHNDKLFHKQKIIHAYPHCWRCDTPLLNYATSSWFVAVTKIKERLIEVNKGIYWIPDNVREGRFGKWLKGARDWALSRNRYWGAPIPVWKSDGEIFVPGSLSELQTRTKAKNKYIFVRHGETDANISKTLDANIKNQKDLNEKGRQQAKEAGDKLKSHNIDIIISSPYNRTKQTAEIIGEQIGITKDSITFEEKISEYKPGASNDGKTWDEFYAQNKGKGLSFIHDKLLGAEESKADLMHRVAKTLYELEEKYEGKTILLVSHKSPMAAIETYNKAQVFDKSTNTIPAFTNFGNAEILELNFKPLPHDETGAVNFHMPFIDNLKVYDSKGNVMVRSGGVFDCWYESGSMPYAQFHYPFENKKLFETNFPADHISEGVDQTRGWFYSMFVLGVALFDKSPYKAVGCTGLVMADDGKKMSKSLKNYTDPMELLSQYGSDAIRYFLLSSTVVKGENVDFADKNIQLTYSKNIGRLLNVLSFYTLYKQDNLFGSSSSEHVLDKFIVARLKQLKNEVTQGFESLEIDRAFRPVEKFIDDLSVWYVRRSRERLKSDDERVQHEAVSTLRYVLFEFAKVLAPIMPFTAEMLWQETKTEMDTGSVHLSMWGDVLEVMPEDIENINNMTLVREMVSAVLDERTKANIKVRQPLQSVTLKTVKYDAVKKDKALLLEILDEVNVKEIFFTKSDGDKDVLLDVTISEELKKEGIYREVLRMVQDKRKEVGLKVADVVSINLANSMSDEEKGVVKEWGDKLKKECNLLEINFADNFEIVR